jgi:hypothetical protein
MTRCKACSREFRKGALAFLLTPKGLTGARVCQSCASGGVLLVAPKLAPVVREKVVRSDGVERALRQLRTLASASRANGAGFTFDNGRAEGFEGAIEVLKRECGQ